MDGEKDGEPHLKLCPADVVKQIKHEATCQHFAGEEGGDESPERRKEINYAMKKARCAKLVCDRQMLVDKYNKDPEISIAIDQALNSINDGGDWKNDMQTERYSCPK